MRSAIQPKTGSPIRRAAGQAAITTPRNARSTPCFGEVQGQDREQGTEPEPDDELGDEERNDVAPALEPAGDPVGDGSRVHRPSVASGPEAAALGCAAQDAESVYHRGRWSCPHPGSWPLVCSSVCPSSCPRAGSTTAASRRASITGYALILWLLGLFVLWRPIGGKFLVPILLIAYIAPFVAGPDRIARLGRIQSGRRGGKGGGRAGRGPGTTKPPMKNVTPPEEPEPETPPVGRP